MEPLFIERDRGPRGRRFAVLHRADTARPRGLIVFAAPFAEEMNKSRRMVAQQSRALAAKGWTILCPDLLGCGDSDGDFGDTTWEDWVDDLVACSHWLRAQGAADPAGTPMGLWGLRAGALLACEAARRLGDVNRLLLWHPQLTGAAVLQQFMRLASASEMLGNAPSGDGQPSLRERIATGDTVEIAGYRISPGLADGLQRAQLGSVLPVDRVDWIEVSSRTGATLTPAAGKQIAAWQAAGVDVRAEVVEGPPFWQTTEIEDAPALLDATGSAMQ